MCQKMRNQCNQTGLRLSGYNTLVTSSGTEIKIGDRVIVQSSQGSKAGALKYYGNTEFGTGLWCGVELDDPLGKNDGSVAGIKLVQIFCTYLLRVYRNFNVNV